MLRSTSLHIKSDLVLLETFWWNEPDLLCILIDLTYAGIDCDARGAREMGVGRIVAPKNECQLLKWFYGAFIDLLLTSGRLRLDGPRRLETQQLEGPWPQPLSPTY
jgi:hypothetical protein